MRMMMIIMIYTKVFERNVSNFAQPLQGTYVVKTNTKIFEFKFQFFVQFWTFQIEKKIILTFQWKTATFTPIVALPTFQQISPAKAPTTTFFKENPAKAAAVPGTEDTAQTFIPAAPASPPPADPPTTILLGCLLISPALWSSVGHPAGVIRNLALTESFREDPSSTWRLETIPSGLMLLGD